MSVLEGGAGVAVARQGAVARPRPSTPPRLRVVDGGAARRRSLARAMVAATVFAVVTLFGVVALHVLLNQGQLQLDHLQTQEARQEARAQKLRLDLAALQSPARVVAAARDRLGMVPPAGVTYVAPGVDGPALAAPPIVAPPTTDAPRTAAAARPAATPAPATPMTGIGAIPGLSAPPTPTPASPSPSATSSEAPHR